MSELEYSKMQNLAVILHIFKEISSLMTSVV